MNPEYILDALGLLDDDLIREAETCTAPRRRSGYRGWMTLAACLTVVIALGYVLTHVGGMGSAGGGAGPEFSGGASTSSDNAQAVEGLGGQDASNGESIAPDPAGPPASAGGSEDTADPGAAGPQEPAGGPEWPGGEFAVLADGTVYQSTEEEVLLEPAESDIQYTIGGKESETGFLPAGTAYVILEPGTAAVRVEETGPWRIFRSVEP